MAQESERKYFCRPLVRRRQYILFRYTPTSLHMYDTRLSLETPLCVSKTDSLGLTDRTAEAGRLGISLRKSRGIPYSARHCPGRGTHHHHLQPTVTGGAADDAAFRNPLPSSYAYAPTGLQRSLFQGDYVCSVEGDLTFPQFDAFSRARSSHVIDRTNGRRRTRRRRYGLTMSTLAL